MDGETCEFLQETFSNGGSSHTNNIDDNDDDSYSIEEGDIGSVETAADTLKNFVVIVNDDGSILVDNSGLLDPAHYDSQTVISVPLPVNKLSNPNNPFPGAKSANQLQLQQRRNRSTGGKMRKPKNQSVVQSGSNVANTAQLVPLGPDDFEESGSAPAIDIDQLGPQDMALLENVLQSAQPDLLANFSFPTDEDSSFVEARQSGGVHLWDHSYSALSAAPQHHEIQVQSHSDGLSQSVLVDSKSISSSSARLSNVSSPAHSTLSSPSGISSPSVRRISEGDNLNIRRSQRHQDRQEKQEADRIKAENQLQLQREREILLQKQLLEQGESPDVIALSPVPVADTSSAVTPVQLPTPGTDKPDGGRRPSRARKVPALLADPNFVQIDDEGKIDEQPMSPTINFDESIVALSARRGEEIDDDEAEDDPEDPNKLWCICKQPHGNKFMICCDKCDDWFHGKCVNVTKQQASLWEKNNREWSCPNCREEIERQKQNQTQTKRRPSVRKGSAASQENDVSVKSIEELETLPSQTAIVKAKAMSSSGIRRKSSVNVSSLPSVLPLAAPTVSTTTDCRNCKIKAPAQGSQFCSPECELSTSQVVSNETKQDASSDAEIAVDKKNKKPIKLEPEKKKADTFLTFHVIQPGSKVSTDVVPAKAKESVGVRGLDRKNSVQKIAASPSTPTTPTSISGKQFYGLESENSTPSSSQASGDNSTPKPSSASEMVKPKSKTTPKSGSEKRKSKEYLEKEKDKRTDTNLIRKNVRKTIGEVLKQRLSSDTNSKFKQEDADRVAQEIDDELDAAYVFGSSNQQKIMTKFRSIVFNIKDMKNNLYLELLKGKIPAEQLVKMDAKDMANRELSQWREQEEKKELEMIQRAELEKLAEAKKQELLDKGKDVEVVEQVQTKLDISDVLDFKDPESGTPITPAKKHGDGDEKLRLSKSHKDKSYEKERHSSGHRSSRDSRRRDDKDKSHRTRHNSRDRTSRSSRKEKDRDREKRRSSKDKYRSDKKRQERGRSKSPNVESKSTEKQRHSSEETLKRNDSVKDAETKVTVSEEPVPVSTADVTLEQQIMPVVKDASVEAEQELPSSTIMTPDFADEKKEESPTSVFRTRMGMHELGTFAASVYNVSHDKIEGVCFPESPVQIVGRIDPNTVWDYVEKMKKIKDVLVFRLQPESSEDVSKYMTFFTYLSTRSRFGVLGGVQFPLKDCYLIPLDKNTPVYPALLPFHGPGLPENRIHCLLAVVIRQPVGPVLKRKPTTESSCPLKKPKLPSKQSSKKRSRPEVSLPMPDDDEPYSPGEEEDETESTTPASTSLLTEEDPIKAQLEEMNRRIAEEQENLASMAKSLMSKSDTIKIPGLGSDLTGESSASTEHLPFFLRTSTQKSQVSSNNNSSKQADTSHSTSSANDLPTAVDTMPVGKEKSKESLSPKKYEAHEPPVVDLDDESYSPTTEDNEVKAGNSATVVDDSNKMSAADEEVLPTIPGFGDPDLSSMSPVLSRLDVDSTTSYADMELEAPPVGEVTSVVVPNASSKPKIALDSVFSLKAPGSSAKPKIQINLKSKLEGLPKEDKTRDDALALAAETAQHPAKMFTPSNASMMSISNPPILPTVPAPASTTSIPFASFGTSPQIPVNLPPPVPPFMGPGPGIRGLPPGLAMPSILPPTPTGVPTMIGGIGINTSIPPPPVPGMQPASSVPPMPLPGFGNSGMMRHGFEGPPGGMNPGFSNVHGFNPGGGRFSMPIPSSGDFSNAPRMHRGHPPRHNTAGFHKAGERDRFRGQGPSRFRRSRSRSRSPGHTQSRSPRDRDGRRRRHLSNSDRTRSPASRRRSRSRSRSRSPRGGSNKRRYSRSRSRSPTDRRRSRSRRSRSRSDSPNVSTPVVKK